MGALGGRPTTTGGALMRQRTGGADGGIPKPRRRAVFVSLCAALLGVVSLTATSSAGALSLPDLLGGSGTGSSLPAGSGSSTSGTGSTGSTPLDLGNSP